MKLFLRKTNSTDPKFVNKDGTLTRYSFACGYVEVWETKKKVPYKVFISEPTFSTFTPVATVKIYHDGCFHVSMRNERSQQTDTYCADNLTKARAFACQQRKSFGGLK